MIAVNFSDFVMLILAVALLLLAGVWLGAEVARHLRERRLRRRGLRCGLCGLFFYDDSPRSLVDCPHCHAAVEREHGGGKISAEGSAASHAAEAVAKEAGQS